MEFDEKKGLSDEDIKKIEEREVRVGMQFRVTSTIRIISGGAMSDFENIKKAMEFLSKQLKKFHHASINVNCPLMIMEKK